MALSVLLKPGQIAGGLAEASNAGGFFTVIVVIAVAAQLAKEPINV